MTDVYSLPDMSSSVENNLYADNPKTELVIIGLGKIGSNLVKNLIKNTSYKINIYDSNKNKTEEVFNLINNKKRLKAPSKIDEIFNSKTTKKIIFILVPSGKKSISLHRKIKKLVDFQDVTLNCCNENYKDSNLLALEFKKSKRDYLSVGISGGTYGARNGLAIMVGGPRKAYQNLLPIFKKIAATKYSVNYFGEMGVGHLVKVLHNYLEYAEMQLLVEKIIFLRLCVQMNWKQIHNLLVQNSKTISQSYLLQLTVGIIKRISDDPEFYKNLLPFVTHNNTGLWGLTESIESESFVPTLQSGVMNRVWLKNMKALFNNKKNPSNSSVNPNVNFYLKTINQTYYFSRLALMMQFTDLVDDVNKKNKISIDLNLLEENWRSGAIVSSKLISKLSTINIAKTKLCDQRQTLRQIYKTFTNTFNLSNKCACPLVCTYSSYIYLTYSSTRDTNSKILALQRNQFGEHPLPLGKYASTGKQ